MQIIKAKDIENATKEMIVKEFRADFTMFISQEAKDYAEQNGITIIDKDAKAKPKKPEHMTNLDAKRLVLKNHPRIILRGKIDTFQAKVLETQILAEELKMPEHGKHASGNQRLCEKNNGFRTFGRKAG